MRHDPALARAATATATIHPIACRCSLCRPLGRAIGAAFGRAAFGRAASLEGYVANVGIRVSIVALALVPGRQLAALVGLPL